MVVRTLLLLLSRDRRDVDLLRAIVWMSPPQWLTREAVMTVSWLCVRDKRSDTGATMERMSGGTSSVVPVRRRRLSLGVGEGEELVDWAGEGGGLEDAGGLATELEEGLEEWEEVKLRDFSWRTSFFSTACLVVTSRVELMVLSQSRTDFHYFTWGGVDKSWGGVIFPW